MARNCDYVVVGGGIAGLMTALRLADRGADVTLVEKGLLGSCATLGNHGIVHSGALFSVLHPEITRQCQEAVTLFSNTFEGARIATDLSWYVGPAPIVEGFKLAWRAQGIAFEKVTKDECKGVLTPKKLGWSTSIVAVKDLIVSSREVVVLLTRMCMSKGVRFRLHEGIDEVMVSEGSVSGVRTTSDERIQCGRVVLCAGLGTGRLLSRFGSTSYELLKSRLDIMVAFRNQRLNRLVVCLELGGPVVAPAADNSALASLYGGTQPSLQGDRKWAVPLSMANNVIGKVEQYIDTSIFDLETARAYMCSKTELVSGHVDKWGVAPQFGIIDHGEKDGVANLWTLLPGKMSLAFHATRELVKVMSGEDPGLPVPETRTEEIRVADELVAQEPWRTLSAAPRTKKRAAAPESA